MIQQILQELDTSQSEAKPEKDAQSSYGNSHMIASCLKLLGQYQS
jgi:hypothetical protein